MKKIATYLAFALSLCILNLPIFAGNKTYSSEININVNDNNNSRSFYVKITNEGEKTFKLLVKGTKIEPIEVKI